MVPAFATMIALLSVMKTSEKATPKKPKKRLPNPPRRIQKESTLQEDKKEKKEKKRTSSGEGIGAPSFKAVSFFDLDFRRSPSPNFSLMEKTLYEINAQETVEDSSFGYSFPSEDQELDQQNAHWTRSDVISNNYNLMNMANPATYDEFQKTEREAWKEHLTESHIKSAAFLESVPAFEMDMASSPPEHYERSTKEMESAPSTLPFDSSYVLEETMHTPMDEDQNNMEFDDECYEGAEVEVEITTMEFDHEGYRGDEDKGEMATVEFEVGGAEEKEERTPIDAGSIEMEPLQSAAVEDFEQIFHDSIASRVMNRRAATRAAVVYDAPRVVPKVQRARKAASTKKATTHKKNKKLSKAAVNAKLENDKKTEELKKKNDRQKVDRAARLAKRNLKKELEHLAQAVKTIINQ